MSMDESALAILDGFTEFSQSLRVRVARAKQSIIISERYVLILISHTQPTTTRKRERSTRALGLVLYVVQGFSEQIIVQ